MGVTLLRYRFPLINHWSIKDDSVAGFWMSHQKPRLDWDSENGSSQHKMKICLKVPVLYPF